MARNSAAGSPDPDAELHLRVDVHDRSRLEWVATVPMAPTGEQHTYEIELEADIPDAMWVAHSPWEHFVVRSRLTSPILTAGARQVGSPLDQLRRRALAGAHALKLAARAPVRRLEAARTGGSEVTVEEAASIAAQVEAGLAAAAAARASFDAVRIVGDVGLAREHALADEYISTQVILLLTRVADAMATRRRKNGRARPGVRGQISAIDAALAAGLAAEATHREARGMAPPAAARSGRDVAAFVHRAALLKKHFQQALFLDARAYMLDQRLRNWIAAAMAMVASTFYFVWQIWVLNAAVSPGGTTVSLITAGAIAALVYAAKDRIKEVGRDWLSHRLKHSYADRVAHLSLQARMDPRRSKIALARETIEVDHASEPDPLNPGLGRTVTVHHLRVRERLRHTGLATVHEQGLYGLKHVFRYDLSPLFVKLDDQVKRLPVAAEGRVRLKSGTRLYAIPVRVRLEQVGNSSASLSQEGLLMVRRSGLVRFVRTDVPGGAPAWVQAWQRKSETEGV